MVAWNINEVRWIGPVAWRKIADANAKQAEAEFRPFPFLEKLEAGAENPVGKLRWVAKLAVACAQFEILRLELQHNGSPGNFTCFQAAGNFFGEGAQYGNQITCRRKIAC